MADARGATPPKTILLDDYVPPDFLVETVDLIFDLGPSSTTVKSRLSLKRNPASSDRAAPLQLNGVGVELVSVALDGDTLNAAAYQLDSAFLTIPAVPDSFWLDIETRIRPDENTELSGLYRSGGNFCTQCEAEGFRRITFFPDRPDVMARYTTTIVADRQLAPVLLSNGNPVDQGDAPNGRHWMKWEDPHPKPSYLFALVAGDLVPVKDQFTTHSGRVVALAIWVRRGDEAKCGHAMQALKDSMRWDETVFGLEYDLDHFNIVAVSDFNMGAMENKGLNIFNTKYVLAAPATATDQDFQGVERVIAHEYFHNWTGDRVTCRDWFQLSLKEGLTVYRDQEFMSDQHSRPVKRISDVRVLRALQFPEDSGPLSHPVRPNAYMQIDNFYTSTVYNKGAELVRMIETLIGKENFRKGMDLYIARHDNQAVTIEDFIAAMQDASGIDLAGFKSWYTQAGTPELEIDDYYDATNQSYDLTITQRTAPTTGQPDKQPQLIPLAMGLIGPDGTALAARLAGENSLTSDTRILRLDSARQTFRFENVSAPPVPSLLRGFSAPVKLQPLSLDRLKFLTSHDSDPFVRWDAGQQLTVHTVLDIAKSWRRGETLTLDPDFIDAVRRILASAAEDPAFAAEALTIPSESELGDHMDIVDVEAIHAARRFVRQTIGRSLAPAWHRLYTDLTDTGAYRVDAVAIGNRALRNTALSYLGATEEAEWFALAHRQFSEACNMTDVLAALVVLNDADRPERDAALAQFFATWQSEELVIDKWFALQAVSRLPSTLERVEALMLHPAFESRNPNRVRALIGSFASANPIHFHDASGRGYQFLADQILRLDQANPQLAARQIQPLGTWRRYDPARQALMRHALERVLSAPKLSKNTFEMASKSLV
jgi:aminopeptidase N